MPTGNGQSLEESYRNALAVIRHKLISLSTHRDLTDTETEILRVAEEALPQGDWRERIRFGKI